MPEELSPAAEAPEEEKSHKNHRARLRKKAFPHVDALPTPQLLELMLFEVLPRCDTNAIAQELLKRSGSLENLLAAPPLDVLPQDGHENSTAAYFRTICYLVQRYADYRSHECSQFYSLLAARDWFLRESAAFKGTEICLLLLTSTLTRLRFARVPCTDIDVIEHVYRLATEISAEFSPVLFVAFTHPNGLLAPSRQEIEATLTLIDLCAKNRGTLADVVIMTREGLRSLGETGIFPPKTFLDFKQRLPAAETAPPKKKLP